MASMTELQERVQSLKASASRARARLATEVGHVVGGLEVTASAGAFGFINGYWGEPEIGPVPVDLGASLTGHVVGFWAGGDVGTHLHRFSDGAAASFANRKTYAAGLEARADSLRISIAQLLAHRAAGKNDDGTERRAA